MAEKKQSKGKIRILPRVIFLIALAVIMGVSFIWAGTIDRKLNLISVTEESYSGSSTNDVMQIASKSDKSLNIHFIDVGQGDACVIQLPDGKTMLIDGGKTSAKTALLTYIDDVIDPDDTMLNRFKNKTGMGFDYVILTHSDEDHCGSIDEVLKLYGTEVFYRPNEKAARSGFTDPAVLFAGATEKGTKAYYEAIKYGSENSNTMYVTNAIETRPETLIKPDVDKASDEYYTFEFFSPISNSYKDYNDYSPVMVLTYQEKRIMLSGDAESAGEKEFVTAATATNNGTGKYSVFDESFHCDVIKLGHHGSRTSSSKEFLEVLTNNSYVQNTVTIVSCGFGNSYKHPHEETIARLIEMGFNTESNMLRTDQNGTIVLSVAQIEGVWALKHGANVVRTEKNTVEIVGNINLQWIEICVTLWVMLLLILLIQPLVAKYKGKLKKIANNISGGNNSSGSNSGGSTTAKKTTTSTTKKTTTSSTKKKK